MPVPPDRTSADKCPPDKCPLAVICYWNVHIAAECTANHGRLYNSIAMERVKHTGSLRDPGES